MGLLRWFTTNWANTREPTHADLAPLDLPIPPTNAVARLQAIIATLPRWQVVTADPIAGRLHLTRTTRLWRFTDDIHLECTPLGTGTRVHAESRSRVGVGDLGQNRRTILELWKAVSGQLRAVCKTN